MATEVNYCAEPVMRDYPSTPNGVLSVGTYFMAVDVLGRSVRRRVSLGRVWGTDLESAKSMAVAVRNNNPEIDVRVNFSMEL